MKRLLLLSLVLAAGKMLVSAEEPGDALLKKEHLGPLRLGQREEEVRRLLGKPDRRGPVVHQEADGSFVQDWQYPGKGLELLFSGAERNGPRRLAHILAQAPCPWKTAGGVGIGSPENEARKIYGRWEERDAPRDPETLVAGSVYGGVIFNFEGGRVARIFFGAAAE